MPHRKLPRWSAALAACLAAAMLAFALPARADLLAASGERMLHDPSLVREGSRWYAFGTGEIERNGIRVLRSENGVHWVTAPPVLAQPLPWWKQHVPTHGPNQWAPDVKHYNGRYWMLYSVSSFGTNTSLIGLLSTPSLASGTWRDDGLVIRSGAGNDFNAIDGDLVIDAEGNPWMSFGSFWTGIKLTRLDKATMKPVGPLHAIAARPGLRHNPIEAPNIVFKDGYYHLFVSFDRCCIGVDSTYKIAHGRSKSITGPYLDKQGVNLLHGGGTLLDTGNAQWKGPGHQDVLDNRYLVRHAYDATRNGMPTLLINDLYWDDQGWPTYDASQAGGVNAGTTYKLRNLASGRLAEVLRHDSADGADVVQWQDNGGAHQHWRLQDAGDGWYHWVNASSGKLMEVYQRARTDGADVRQWSANGGTHQQWRLVPQPNGSFTLINRHSGKALDGFGTADGSNVIQFGEHGGANQQWTLTPVR